MRTFLSAHHCDAERSGAYLVRIFAIAFQRALAQ